ncbi:hypothetical protein AB0M11_18840 [Streptomyces sp. NPDC051987]|uniref:hypothetical protein n=1 Tax=Streptomyces sp. NPDC051987 TaxID=3155808 RepID=UPI00344A34DB
MLSASQQVGTDVREREGPLEAGHESVVDLVAPGSPVPVEETGAASRADTTLHRFDTGQGGADRRRQDRRRRMFGGVPLDVVVGGVPPRSVRQRSTARAPGTSGTNSSP